MKYKILKVFTLLLVVLSVVYFVLQPDIKKIVKQSAVILDKQVLIDLYVNYPGKKVEIDENVIIYWGVKIDHLDYDTIDSLYKGNTIEVLRKKISNRRKLLASDIMSSFKNFTVDDFKTYLNRYVTRRDLVIDYIREKIKSFNYEEMLEFESQNDLNDLNNIITEKINVEKSKIFKDLRLIEYSQLDFYLKEYPKRQDLVFEFLKAEISVLNFEGITALKKYNSFELLEIDIEYRVLKLTSKLLIDFKGFKLNEFSSYFTSFPERIDVANIFFEDYVLNNFENYQYDDLYNIYREFIVGLPFDTEFASMLMSREEVVMEDIADLTIKDLNAYHLSYPGNDIVINEFLKNSFLPVLKEFNYFELKEIAPLLAFSSINQEIAEVKESKRIQVLDAVQDDLLEKQLHEESSFLIYKEELRSEVDQYFNTSFDKFCEEYFDFGSSLYRGYAGVADIVTQGDRIERDFVEDWNKFIDKNKIGNILNTKSEIFIKYIMGMRKESSVNVSKIINESTSFENGILFEYEKDVSFKGVNRVSTNFNKKNLAAESSFLLVEGVAASLTAGTSLIVTRGISFIGSMYVSYKNEDVAKERYKQIYNNSITTILDNIEIDFKKNTKLYNLNLKKSLNAKL
jgi:hypothetical protein